MSIEIRINGQAQGPAYIGWTPQSISISSPSPQAQVLLLKSVVSGQTGEVSFLSARNGALQTQLSLTVPAGGIAVNAFIAGETASERDQDITIGVFDQAGALLASRTVMVRVRKNANTLKPHERNRFIDAFMKFFVSQQSPNYTDFLTMHNADADNEIHQRPSFLVWHRAFLLDLERQLQKYDTSVALPYWKFDEAAPNVFSADFMGAADSVGRLKFNTGNKFGNWSVNGVAGLVRLPLFNDQASPAQVALPGFGVYFNAFNYGIDFARFMRMEGNPHGWAHSLFGSGPINSPYTATSDPLFFLLHANVDRLWAEWQQLNQRYDITQAATYPLPGKHTAASQFAPGDYLKDTMWPWNGAKQSNSPTRPPSAPGGPFPQVNYTALPSPKPEVWELFDYQGYRSLSTAGFDYDKIFFQHQNATV